MSIPNAYLWFLLGCLFTTLEILGFAGIGFFFVGLAGLSVGILVSFDFIAEHNFLIQVTWFLAFISTFALALYNPLKRYRRPNQRRFKDIVGQTGVVVQGNLIKGKIGNVRWSGTNMAARSIESAPTVILEGTEVEILEVTGNQLIVQIKNQNPL